MTDETIVLDPVEFMPDRVELGLDQLGLAVRSAEWGDSEHELFLVRRALGEIPAGSHPPNRTATIVIRVQEESPVSLAEASQKLQQKVGLLQREQGAVRRDLATDGGFAVAVAHFAYGASLGGLHGWQMAHRQQAPDVVLTLQISPYCYGVTEEDLGDNVETGDDRGLQFTEPIVKGSAPGLIRVTVDNDGANDWLGLLASIESRDYDAAATALPHFEAEALTRLGATAIATRAGASGAGITNLVTNPGFEVNLAGWSDGTSGNHNLNAGSTITRVLTAPHGGVASAKVVTTAASGAQGISFPFAGTFVAGVQYTERVWLKGNAGGEAVTVILGDTAVGDLGQTNVNLTNAWQEIVVTWTPTADRTNIVSLDVRSQAAQVLTWFVDDASVLGGENVVEHTNLPPSFTALLESKIVASGLDMTHRGPRVVVARVRDPNAVAGTVDLRLEWAVGPYLNPRQNDSVTVPLIGDYSLVVLGEARIDEAPIGSHRWRWRILGRSRTPGNDIAIDDVWVLSAEQLLKLVATETAPAGVFDGPRSPATLADDAGVGTVAWVNPANAASSNDTRAVATLANNQVSHYLKATNFNFAVPGGATILGVVAEIEKSQANNPVRDSQVRLVKGGAIGATDRADTVNTWTAADAYKVYGAGDDLWGETLTVADVNAANFGVAIAAIVSTVASGDARVDHVRMTVYYSTASEADAVCFDTRTVELRSDGVFRQDAAADVYGHIVPESGMLPYAPPSALEERPMRVVLVPTRGNFAAKPDSGAGLPASARARYFPGFHFASEAAP